MWEAKIPEFINEKYIEIRRSALRNEVMWPEWIPFFNVEQKSYENIIDDMKKSFIDQLNFMDTYINGL